MSEQLLKQQLILGCMRMAALSEQDAASVVQTALDHHITLFDHADIYGGGDSERRFQQAMKSLRLSRDKVLIQSKCGIRKGYFDFSKEHIINSVDGILQRLDTDYLDMLLLHRPDTLMEPEEVASAFVTLQDAGKVRAFGVSNQNPIQMQLLQQALPMPLVANQLQFGPAHTPMIDSGLNVNMLNEASIVHDLGVLEYCRLTNVVIQAWSPFQVDLEQGLFMDHLKYRVLTEIIDDFAHDKGCSPEAIVIAWIKRHPAKMQPIIGSMSPQRIERLAQGMTIELSREEWYTIYRSAGNLLP